MNKPHAFLLAAALSGAAVFAQPAPAGQAAPAPADRADLGYALGIAIGTNLREVGVGVAVPFDYDAFLLAVRAVVEGGAVRMTPAEADKLIQGALASVKASKGKANAEAGRTFLEANGRKAGVSTTSSGLQYEVLRKGSGAKPSAADSVKIHYVGTLADGTKFDSSLDRGQPAVLSVGQVIPGFSEGLQLMSVGSKYRLVLPPELAYGAESMGSAIGPNSVLVFEVELLGIEAAKKK